MIEGDTPIHLAQKGKDGRAVGLHHKITQARAGSFAGLKLDLQALVIPIEIVLPLRCWEMLNGNMRKWRSALIALGKCFSLRRTP